MFRRIRERLADRKKRKAAKYADDVQHMDRAELQRLREEHSPLGGSGGSGGAG